MAIFMFPTVLTPATFTAADNNTDLVLALGVTTYVKMVSTQNLTFNGLSAIGGNLDGMVVCLQNVTFTSAFAHSFAHETSSTPANRFRNAGLTSVNGGSSIGAVTYRYDGAQLRWMEIARTT